MAAGGMPAAQSQIAKTAPPYRLARSTTEYKYEEIAEIIGKVGKTYLVNVLSVLHAEKVGRGLTWGRRVGGVRLIRRFLGIVAISPQVY
jgi:hypothetical protein